MTQRTSYGYDRAGQLAARWVGGALNVNQTCQPVTSPGAVPGDSGATYACTGPYDSTNTVAYAWDAVGNPRANGTAVAPNTGNQLTGTASEQFGYDADGNLVTRFSNSLGRTTAAYTWNSLNQLVQVQGAASTVTFGYDASGRRVRKSVTANGATTTTYFVWDGDDLAADVDAGGNTVAMYSYYPGGMDQPLSVQLAATGYRYYYVTEPPGHVTALVDNAGAPVVTYRYADPFGAPPSTGGPGIGGFTNRLMFGAREYDAETGLYYMRARYYDPALGRFISPDPTGLAAGVNWYAYAGNDPVNYRDPTGLGPFCEGDMYWFTTVTQGGVSTYSTQYTPGTCTTNAPETGPVGPTGPGPGPGGGPTKPQPPTPPDRPIFRITHEVPRGSLDCTGPTGRTFYAPPTFNLADIVAAGRAGSWSPRAALNAVGHYGTFDFQRRRDATGNTTFISAYTPVSNVAVGAYLQGAGFSEAAASRISNFFAFLRSSNAGDPNQGIFRREGYLAAGGGSLQCTGG